MSKPDWHKQVEKSRRSFTPEVGATVYYPQPLPAFSHPDDGSTPAVPTPSEHPDDETQWHEAKVIEIEHRERTVDPDSWVAILETAPGLTVPIAVEFLKPRKPTRRRPTGE